MKACTQCGRCCTNPKFMGSLMADDEDVLRWEAEGRYDILDWVSVLGPENDPYGDLWISPTTGDDAQSCPFVRRQRDGKYKCQIYKTRPAVCRAYPIAVDHMKAVDCEMLETGDTDADDVRKRQPVRRVS